MKNEEINIDATGALRVQLDTVFGFLPLLLAGGEGRGEEASCFKAEFPSPQPSPRLGGARELN